MSNIAFVLLAVFKIQYAFKLEKQILRWENTMASSFTVSSSRCYRAVDRAVVVKRKANGKTRDASLSILLSSDLTLPVMIEGRFGLNISSSQSVSVVWTWLSSFVSLFLLMISAGISIVLVASSKCSVSLLICVSLR